MTLVNGGIDEFLAWEQRQVQHSEITQSVDFHFLLDSPGSAKHLAKQCEFQNSYCCLSPTALQRPHYVEDQDPSVLNDDFFSEISLPALRPCSLASSAKKEIFQKHFEEAFASGLPDLSVGLAAESLKFHHLEAGMSDDAEIAGAPPHHRRKRICLDKNTVTGSTTIHDKGKNAMFEALKNEALSEKDIFQRFGKSQQISHLLREILREGLIQRTGKGGAKDPFRYYARQ
jgi:hypothetical protein